MYFVPFTALRAALASFARNEDGKVSLSWLLAVFSVIGMSAGLLTHGAEEGIVPLKVGIGADVEVDTLPAHNLLADPFLNRL